MQLLIPQDAEADVRLDKDKDGKMTKAEYDASGARAFAQQDKDKNGKISDADAVVERAEASTKPASN